jgi:Zn-dependent M28 family amino/carboxypeptidase
MKNKRLGLLLLIALLASATLAQKKPLTLSSEDEIKADLKLVPCKNVDRLVAVRTLFEKKGAAEADITVDKMKDVQNVVFIKKGKTDEIVVIGAHYDKVSEGCGAIDNWTGIVIIANIFRTLKQMDTDKTYVFVAFDKEESGLVGSAAMVKSIPKEKRAAYCSMVNLDSFGFGYPQVLENASTPKMTTAAKDLAAELKMPFSSVSLAGVADADSSSFKDKDIPAVTFHGLDNRWRQFLHSSNDKLENINAASVWVGYNFLLQYLAKIDSSSCGIFRNK